MGSRRGRLNWSNLDVRISDEVIEKQHCFTISNSLSPISASADDIVEDEKETSSSTPASTKKGWVPKADVGEILAEQFIGNFMLTDAEQTSIEQRYNKKTTNDQKYKKQINNIQCSNSSPKSKSIRISSRLSMTRDNVLSPRISNLYVGQHLLNVFVCHVESFSRVYIMFGDDYNRATKLFQDMNNCPELTQPSTTIFEPKDDELIAINHENKWFRGRCLNSIGTSVDVLCIDSGVKMSCSRNNILRLPDMFRISSSCCIECSLSGLPIATPMSAIPETIHNECIELLYKDRYEAIVTKLESPNHPTIVLYYKDENINDRLLTLLRLI